MLSGFVNENHTDWDEQLPYVMMAYRSSVHESSGFTSNSLMLGREVSSTLDIMYSLPTDLKAVPQSKWCWILKERLGNAHKTVRKNLQQASLRQKHYHDRKLHWESFHPGDQVYVYFPRTQVGKSPMLTQCWHGHFRVIQKLSDVTYLVDCNRKGKDQVIHVDRMKWLHSQRLVGESDDAVSSEQAGPAGKKESGSDEPWVKEDQDDDLVNDSSDVPTIPCARSGLQIRKPAWHADYEM